jgi:hypothetical protein
MRNHPSKGSLRKATSAERDEGCMLADWGSTKAWKVLVGVKQRCKRQDEGMVHKGQDVGVDVGTPHRQQVHATSTACLWSCIEHQIQ